MTKPQTIPDIIADHRQRAKAILGNGVYEDILEKEEAEDAALDHEIEADRIEAAYKRELGNVQKMREALIHARAAICKFAKYQCDSLSWENSNMQANCGDGLCSWRGLCDAKTAINAALVAPARNCDVGTVEEQTARYNKFCCKNKTTERSCGDCPAYFAYAITKKDCRLAWAQMPYEEESK